VQQVPSYRTSLFMKMLYLLRGWHAK